MVKSESTPVLSKSTIVKTEKPHHHRARKLDSGTKFEKKLMTRIPTLQDKQLETDQVMNSAFKKSRKT